MNLVCKNISNNNQIIFKKQTYSSNTINETSASEEQLRFQPIPYNHYTNRALIEKNIIDAERIFKNPDDIAELL